MSTETAAFEVYALRYSSRSVTRSTEFFRYDLYREPDGEMGLDYFFWLVRNEKYTVLVDCGFDRDRAAAKNRFHDNDPAGLLSRLGVGVGDVDHVVITHMHYDHVGNVGLFPKATFSIAREELEFWTGPYADRKPLTYVVDPVEVEIVRKLENAGRLRVIDGSAEIVPGIVVTTVGGHTSGQMMAEVAARSGQVVLASDMIHFYEELERDRPFNLFTDLAGMYRGYDILRELSARPGTTVIAGHDPLVRSMFREVAPECFDLTSPLA